MRFPSILLPAACLFIATLLLALGGAATPAQEGGSSFEPGAGERAEADQTGADPMVDAETLQSLMEPDAPPVQQQPRQPTGIDLLSLITQGGGFMIPIGLMSLLVVTLAVERMISLRRVRLIPKGLVEELEGLADPIDRFNPSTALAACRDFPSAAATAIEAMLMRTGQPLADVERAATEAIQREADDHAAPIRWLSLAAAATPLMGLLGTVWGMIMAFHESTTLTPDRSRSEQLSEGIYTALVTTLAGLAVAIPAAIFAQYLENRLAKHFHRIERLVFRLAPALHRFVGRARMDSDGKLKVVQPPAVASPPAAAGSPQPVGAASGSAAQSAATQPVPLASSGDFSASTRRRRGSS